MNILIVSQHFWPENFRITDLALGFLERGHQVTVLTGMPNYPSGKIFPGYSLFHPSKETYQGIPIIRTPIIPRGSATSFRLVLNYLSFVLSAGFLGLFRCRDKYDVIYVYATSPITQCLPALLLKWTKKIPLILNVQDLWPESLTAAGAVNSKIILNMTSQLVRFIYKHCDKILVQSRGFIDNIIAMGVRGEKVDYFPNFAETLYRPVDVPEEAEERFQIPKGFIVMFAGNIGVAQDFPTILEAAELLKDHLDIHFIVFGDGRQKAWVQSQVEQRNLSRTVHLLGQYPVEKMPIYFALADVMLVTLKKEPIFALTIPAKVQSYMACGKPIVAALDGEGAKVITEAEAGFVVHSENTKELSEAILKLYSLDKDQRKKMGERALKYFKANFEREMLLNQLQDWLKKLTQKDA